MKWENVSFGSLYQQPSRNGLSKPSRVRGSGVKMVNMGELFAHDRIFDIPMELVPVTEKELSSSMLEQEDLLFARQSLVLEGAGKCSIVKEITEPTVFESHLIRVRLDPAKAIPEFYYYYFKSALSPIKSIVSQCAQAGIKATDLAMLPVSYPPLAVQKKIADALALYDSLIENNRRQIKLLEEAARRLYKEWFVDLRFPGHEQTPTVNGVPQGWTECKIKDACLKIFSGGTPSRKKTAYWQGGQIPWFKTKELTDSWLIQSEERITEDALAASSAKIHLRGTILMAIYASPTLGRLGILDCDATCNQAALGLLANPDVCSEMWLFLKLMELRSDFNALARGAGQQNISADVVKNTSVVIPGNGVMKCFSELVNPIYGRILRAQKQMLFLSEARDRLLPKLMSGEVEV